MNEPQHSSQECGIARLHLYSGITGIKTYKVQKLIGIKKLTSLKLKKQYISSSGS